VPISLPAFARAVPDGIELRLKVVPGASSTAFAGVLGDRLKVRIAAAPEHGEANKALLTFVSAWLACKQVELVTGHRSAEKTVLARGLRGLDQAQVTAALA
jgi:uncharacterized protein